MEAKHSVLVGFIVVLFLVNVLIVAGNYGSLPEEIPTHFSASGEPDSHGPKSMILLYPGLQILFLLIALLVYKYPNYANIPSTIALKNLQPEIKEKAYGIIRNTTLITMSIVSLLMVYLATQTLEVAKKQASAINPWGLYGILLLLAPVVVYYAIRMRRLS